MNESGRLSSLQIYNMQETEKITAQFAAFHQGDSWIGLNFKEAIKGITATTALNSMGKGNCIWQLVNHLIYWRKTVLIRLQHTLGHPPMPDMYLPDDLSPASWQATLEHFDEVYALLHQQVATFDPALLDQPSPMKEQTYYQLLVGCLQHDAYHLGQIVQLKQLS
jgi:hypothetical protein